MADSGFDYQEALADIDQRVAILKRYRRMLDLQREKLQGYLAVIDSREASLSVAGYERLEEYTVLEQEAVRSIVTVQRCLEPLKNLYLELNPEGDRDIADMEQRLERLRVEVLARNSESRALLRGQAEALRLELTRVRSTRRPASVFARSSDALMVDVQA